MSIRPRFQKQSILSKEELIKRISCALDHPHASIKGTIIDPHIILRIPIKEQHYWSPQLDLEMEDIPPSGSLIKGLFGPNPSVWFMYVFFYSVLGFISVMVMIMGFAQLNLGLSARILWALPVITILFFFAYYTAKTGQRLGAEDMQRIYNFLDEAIEGNIVK